MKSARVVAPLDAELEPMEVVVRDHCPEYDQAAEELWTATGARPCRQGAPTIRLVACDGGTGEFLGVADCYRTFPPEHALGAVAVMPGQRRRGIGRVLLRALADAALYDGRRTLCGFVLDDDLAAWRLFHAAGMPIRIHEVEGGLYYEVELLSPGRGSNR